MTEGSQSAEAEESKLGQEERLLQKALRPLVETTLEENFRERQEQMAEMLYPVIGRAVRKSVREALKGFADSINRTMESTLTMKWLRWRWEAKRTGKPLAEIVFQKSLLYQVEEVFLIHENTGLLIRHLARESEVQDRDLVSGMLQAIGDFVADSFRQPKSDRLEGFTVGDLNVWLSHGPLAYLAIVIRGEAPAKLREHFARVVEDIHQNFQVQLKDYTGNSQGLEQTEPLLEQCFLQEQRKSSEGKSPFLRVAALIALVALSWAVGKCWFRRAEARALAKHLSATPGFVVLESQPGWSKTKLSILRDPRAEPTGKVITERFPKAQWEHSERPYVSLDPPLLLEAAKRATASISTEQDQVRWEARDSRLYALGQARGAWHQEARKRLTEAGMNDVTLDGLVNLDRERCFVLAKEIAGLAVEFESSQLTLPEKSAEIISQLAKALPACQDAARAAGENPSAQLFALSPNSPLSEADILLARRRAETVRARLVEQGLAPELLIAKDAPPQTLPQVLPELDKKKEIPRVILVPSCILRANSE